MGVRPFAHREGKSDKYHDPNFGSVFLFPAPEGNEKIYFNAKRPLPCAGFKFATKNFSIDGVAAVLLKIYFFIFVDKNFFDVIIYLLILSEVFFEKN